MRELAGTEDVSIHAMKKGGCLSRWGAVWTFRAKM